MARQQRLRALMPARLTGLAAQFPSCPPGSAPPPAFAHPAPDCGTDPRTMHRTGTRNLTSIRARISRIIVRILRARGRIRTASCGCRTQSTDWRQHREQGPGTTPARNSALAARHPDPQFHRGSRENRCRAGPWPDEEAGRPRLACVVANRDNRRLRSGSVSGSGKAQVV